MNFILIAYDGKNPGALDHRMEIRPEHLEKISHVKKAGQYRSEERRVGKECR